MRRSRLRLLVGLAWGLLVFACALGWVVGRVFSDRYLWSQPVSWIPTPLLLAPVWIAAGLAWARGRRRRRAARRRGGAGPVRSSGPAIAAGVLWVVGAASAAHLFFVEVGLHRALLGRAARGGQGGAEVIRVVFWNQAARAVGDISATFLAMDPTLLVLANRHTDTKTRDLAQAFRESGDVQAAVGWPFDLFSRVRMRRWGSTSLGLDGRSRGGNGATREDSGWAAWFEVESGNGVITVWALDLPSDPAAARFPLARAAGEAIAAWEGSVRVREADGWHAGPDAGPGFPAPDLIVGDFNIPRGSASLGEFLRASGAGAMRNAFDEAGWGWERTWPRRTPVLAIDQCFVNERVRAVGFKVVDPGFGGHRALVVEVELTNPE